MGYLVNKVERYGSLPDPHLFGLPVLPVLGPDAVHALLQPPGGLVLLPILLALNRPSDKHTPMSALMHRLEVQLGG